MIQQPKFLHKHYQRVAGVDRSEESDKAHRMLITWIHATNAAMEMNNGGYLVQHVYDDAAEPHVENLLIPNELWTIMPDLDDLLKMAGFLYVPPPALPEINQDFREKLRRGEKLR